VIEGIISVEAVFTLNQDIAVKGKHTATVQLTAINGNGVLENRVVVEPASARLTVEIADKTLTKEVEVKVPLTGALALDYKLEGVAVNPARVHLTGAFAEIEKIQEVFVEAVSLDGRDSNIVLELPLKIPPELKSDPATVHIILRIQKK
jgi:YbbR domain-containing protein